MYIVSIKYILFIVFLLFGDMKNTQLKFIKHRAVSKKLKLSKLYDKEKRNSLLKQCEILYA